MTPVKLCMFLWLGGGAKVDWVRRERHLKIEQTCDHLPRWWVRKEDHMFWRWASSLHNNTEQQKEQNSKNLSRAMDHHTDCAVARLPTAMILSYELRALELPRAAGDGPLLPNTLLNQTGVSLRLRASQFLIHQPVYKEMHTQKKF